MESESFLTRTVDKIRTWLSEQEWFQQLRAKWDELDPQSRLYLRLGGAAGGALLVLIVVFSMMWNVHSLKREYREKQELLTLLDGANDELRKLRDLAPAEPAPGEEKPNWPAYLESVGKNVALEKENLEIGDEKAGTPSEQAKETLLEVKIKRANIRQILRYAFLLENGSKPVKVRNLTIDTKADPSGYMDASLAVSGFSIVAANK